MSVYDDVVELIFNDNVRDFYDRIDNTRDLKDINIFNDLAYNSLSFIQLIIDLEQTFNIVIPDDYLLMENLSTVSQVCDMVSILLERDL